MFINMLYWSHVSKNRGEMAQNLVVKSEADNLWWALLLSVYMQYCVILDCFIMKPNNTVINHGQAMSSGTVESVNCFIKWFIKANIIFGNCVCLSPSFIITSTQYYNWIKLCFLCLLMAACIIWLSFPLKARRGDPADWFKIWALLILSCTMLNSSPFPGNEALSTQKSLPEANYYSWCVCHWP